jgi:hypothetical protein
MTGIRNLSRRDFLEGSGALILGFTLSGFGKAMPPDGTINLGSAAEGGGTGELPRG